MANEPLLSKDEVDALLQAAGDSAVQANAPAVPGEVRAFDFARQDHLTRGRLPTLDIVNERFLRLWRAGLAKLLRRAPEVCVAGVDIVKFGEYVHSLALPTHCNLLRAKPLRGTAMVTLQPALVFGVVDRFFGGGGRTPASFAGREFTPSEQRIVELMLQQLLADLGAAWAAVHPLEFEYAGHEDNPHHTAIVAPREQVVVTRLQVEFDGGGGQVHVVLPWPMLEPIHELLGNGLQGDRPDHDGGFAQSLRDQLLDADVEVSSTLAQIRSSLRELLRMKAGDVLPLELPGRIRLSVEDLPLFEGEYGVANGQRAIRITDIPPGAPRRRSGAPA